MLFRGKQEKHLGKLKYHRDTFISCAVFIYREFRAFKKEKQLNTMYFSGPQRENGVRRSIGSFLRKKKNAQKTRVAMCS